MNGAGAEGPSLTLERDAGEDGVAGTTYVLEGEQVVVGNAPGLEGIAVRNVGLSRRHLRLTQEAGSAGTWFIADVHGEPAASASASGRAIATFVNGARLTDEPRALHDGDRIHVDTGGPGVTFTFRDRGRLITGVTRRGRGRADVVTFCPWHRYPSLSYALREGREEIHTAIEPSTQWFVSSGLPHSSTEAATHVDGAQIVPDLYGIFLGDVVRASLDERATIDVTILFEVARLAGSVPSGVHLRHRALLTFSGALVWFGDPAAGQSAALRQGIVHQLLVTLGCEPRVVGPSPVDTLRAQRGALDAVPVDDDARRALLRVVDVAIEDPAHIADALVEGAAALGGAPSTSDVRGLLVNLFPNEHARHERVTEEAQLLGFAGVAALA